jgi:tetratricopeptide (TPR) repeat protein
MTRPRAFLFLLLFFALPLRAQPDSSGAALLKRGVECFTNGSSDSAAQLCRRAIAADSTLVGAYDLLGRIASEGGDCGEAERLFLLALRRDSTRAELLIHAAQSACSCGFLSKGETRYRKVLSLAPGETKWIAGLAQVQMQQGEYDSAITRLTGGAERDSLSLPLHFMLGSCYTAKKKYGLAIAEFRKTLEINASYFPALKELAACYLQIDSFWNAAAEYQTAVRMQPDDAGLRVSLANCYLKVKQYRQALDLLGPLEGSAYSATVYGQEGLCYYFLAKYDTAVIKFRAGLGADSTQPATAFNLGLALMSLGKYRAAIGEFERAIRLGRTDLAAGSYDRIGSAWYALKRTQPALRAYRRAIEEKPLMPIAYYNLGVLYENSFKDVGNAVSCYRKVVALTSPSDDPNALRGKAIERLKLLQKK